MKRCISCKSLYSSSDRNCPDCGNCPTLIDGFDSYAPEVAHGGGGFKADYFLDLVNLEDTNFWFRARNELILWMIEKYARPINSYLEIGCGTGYVLSAVSKRFPTAKVHGSEIFVAGLGIASSRLPLAKFMQMDARNIPYENEFDVIGAFDVLEHIKEDQTVLAQMYAALNPGGCIVISVPQHMWLWSSKDEYAFHERRYVALDLHRKIESAGFKILRSTSFVTSLLPAMMTSRFFQKEVTDEKFDAMAELRISPWLNGVFGKFLEMDLGLIKIGLNLPVGGSRLVVGRKL